MAISTSMKNSTSMKRRNSRSGSVKRRVNNKRNSNVKRQSLVQTIVQRLPSRTSLPSMASMTPTLSGCPLAKLSCPFSGLANISMMPVVCPFQFGASKNGNKRDSSKNGKSKRSSTKSSKDTSKNTSKRCPINTKNAVKASVVVGAAVATQKYLVPAGREYYQANIQNNEWKVNNIDPYMPNINLPELNISMPELNILAMMPELPSFNTTAADWSMPWDSNVPSTNSSTNSTANANATNTTSTNTNSTNTNSTVPAN